LLFVNVARNGKPASKWWIMKAIELTHFNLDSFRVVDKTLPPLAAGSIRVRMRAASLNYRDLLVATGVYDPRIKLPTVPLSDGAGEVAEVSAGVTRFKVGDRVANLFMPGWLEGEITPEKSLSALGAHEKGVLAEYVDLPEQAWVPIPEHLSFEQAATLPCAAVTAWNALVGGNIKAGDSVLLQGTGGVSLFALQFAKVSGARIIIMSSSDEKLARTLKMGAAEGINYRTTPDWDKRVRELTDGRGVDHIVEVGGAGTLPRSFKAVRAGGLISLIGVLTGGGEVNPTPLLMKSITMRGIYVGSRAMMEAMNRAIGLHKIEPVIDRVFEFGQIGEALGYLKSGAHFGKVVMRIS
jgi:NADPH:quinone reductase-like Zn-dependent oxidoreductase